MKNAHFMARFLVTLVLPAIDFFQERQDLANNLDGYSFVFITTE